MTPRSPGALALAARKKAEHAERNRRSWLAHHRHGVATFVAGCLPCEDAPLDRDPFDLSTQDY